MSQFAVTGKDIAAAYADAFLVMHMDRYARLEAVKRMREFQQTGAMPKRCAWDRTSVGLPA